MKKKWEIIIFTCLSLILAVGVFSPVFSQFDGGGAFGSITNYLKQVMTNIIPNANNTYNLGAASKRFSNAYIVNANFADGTSMNTAASGASANGNAGAIQYSDGHGNFISDVANFSYSGGATPELLTPRLQISSGGTLRNYSEEVLVGAPLVNADSSGARWFNQVCDTSSGWPYLLMQGQRPIIMSSSWLTLPTTQFEYNTSDFVILNGWNGSSGNFVGASIGFENQNANSATPFFRIHALKGNQSNSAATTPETIPSVEIGDLGTATSLPANADNGSVVADRHLCAGEGGAANGACCFMADGKTLGHCTSVVGANGTCTCAD